MRILLSIAAVSLVLSVAVSELLADLDCNSKTLDSPTRCTTTFNLCEGECGAENICEDEYDWLGFLVAEADVRVNRTNNDSESRNCVTGTADSYCADGTPVKCYVDRACYEQDNGQGQFGCSWGQECDPANYADKVDTAECRPVGG